MILLDTDICIDIIRRRDTALMDRLAAVEGAVLAISSITLAELEFGAANSSDPERNHLAVTMFASAFDIVPFDSRHARTYGEIRAYLSRKGMMIGPHDLQFAAQALSDGMMLATRNSHEFESIPGLVTIDTK